LTTAYPADATKGAVFSANTRSDVQRTYRAALRHSRYVRWLRYVVIIGIVIVLLGVVAANYIPPLGGFRLPGDLGSLVIKGTKITMQQPRLTGYTSDSRLYEFSANSAAQDITKPDFMEMQQLHAKMEMEDRSTVEMSAASGTYDVKAELLTLKDNIDLVSSSGYAGRLSEAVIDVRKGNVVSDKPVWLKLLNGVLNAQRLEVIDKGSVIRFSGVTMTLQPETGSGNSAKASQQ